MKKFKVLAFDLDGTLTQHKTPLGEENRSLLDTLRESYHLLMVGAGQCYRIYHQMGEYPIDIIGNYGMQFSRYEINKGILVNIYDEHVPCDKEDVTKRIDALRQKQGFTSYSGESVEFHSSGCVTYPLLGTTADLSAKLAFDPDRSKRRAILEDVKSVFPDFNVFIGGSSSFDLSPFPYDKYYALDRYAQENGFCHDDILYIGDDYGPGGNDEAVYRSDISFLCVDDYTSTGNLLKNFLQSD